MVQAFCQYQLFEAKLFPIDCNCIPETPGIPSEIQKNAILELTMPMQTYYRHRPCSDYVVYILTPKSCGSVASK